MTNTDPFLQEGLKDLQEEVESLRRRNAELESLHLQEKVPTPGPEIDMLERDRLLRELDEAERQDVPAIIAKLNGLYSPEVKEEGPQEHTPEERAAFHKELDGVDDTDREGIRRVLAKYGRLAHSEEHLNLVEDGSR